MRTQLVYDFPTRFFHWIFAGLFLMAFLIAKLADDESSLFSYHMLTGITLSFIVLQRIIWGLLGTEYARFSSFSLHPQKVLEYFRGVLSGASLRDIGHNPASSWAAIIMILLTLGLGTTGYLMTGTEQKEIFEDLHEILANTFIIVVISHVLGVILHSIRHKDMIALSMIDGKKVAISGTKGISSKSPAIAVLFLALTLGFIFNLAKNYDSKAQKLTLFGSTLELSKHEGHEHNHDD